MTTSSPETPGIKRASRGGEWGAHVGLSRHDSVSPGPFMGHSWGQGGRSHGKSRTGLYPVPTGSMSRESPSPTWLQFTAQGLLWVGGLTVLSLGLGTGGHGQRARAQSWEEEKACPQRRAGQCVHSPDLSLACGLLPLAPARPPEGCSATLGPQVSSSVLGRTAATGVPRKPPRRLSIPLFPDPRKRFRRGAREGHRVTARLSAVGLAECRASQASRVWP